MTIQKIVIPSSFTNHSPLLNLGMTIQVIVIPKFQNPLWHSTALSYSSLHLHHRSYTYSRIHTRKPLSYIEFFQVFCVKTCWFRDFQALIACWLLINNDFKSKFCQILFKPSSTESNELGCFWPSSHKSVPSS